MVGVYSRTGTFMEFGFVLPASGLLRRRSTCNVVLVASSHYSGTLYCSPIPKRLTCDIIFVTADLPPKQFYHFQFISSSSIIHHSPRLIRFIHSHTIKTTYPTSTVEAIDSGNQPVCCTYCSLLITLETSIRPN